MWFHLELDGISFHFRISSYKKSIQDTEYEQWCNVDLTLQSGSWLNYQTSPISLLSCDIEELRDKLSDLLSNKLLSQEKLEFVEPDITFLLHPQKDLTLDPSFIYVAPEHKIEDINTDIHIHLWNGVLTENYISLRLGRKDMEALQSYLKLITHQIKMDDPSIKKLMESDIIRKY